MENGKQYSFRRERLVVIIQFGRDTIKHLSKLINLNKQWFDIEIVWILM